MFKLAVFTDEISQDLKRTIEVSKEFNLDGLELRSVWNRGPFQYTKNDIKKIGDMTRDAGLSICSIASPFYKCDLDNLKDIKAHQEGLKRCIDMAYKLDCKIIRGFCFWRKGIPGKVFDEIVDKFEKPVEMMKKAKLYMGIENESSTYFGNGEWTAKFVKTINSPWIKVTWDPANEVHDTDWGGPAFPEGFEWVKDLIIHVHLKDAVRYGAQGKPECVAVGEGDINYWGQLKALKDMNYEGYVSLETHWRGGAKKLTEELVNVPGGAAYTAAAEESSKYCLRNLYKILSSL